MGELTGIGGDSRGLQKPLLGVRNIAQTVVPASRAMSLWRVRLLVAGLAAALGDLPAWECVTKRPCSIQFSGDNVTAEDLILVSTSETCDTCFRTDAGVCPWLDGDSGVEDLTICQVGNTTTWRCQGVGKGDRVLCPPDYQMCLGSSSHLALFLANLN